MTNFEKYKDVILAVANTSDYGIALCDGKVEKCITTNCERCNFYSDGCCESAMLKWLYEEAKK